jgi:hypothetical protein
MMKPSVLLFSLLAACASKHPAPEKAPPVPSPPSRSEVIRILARLESTFYTHWGSVEKTPEYAALPETAVPVLRELVESNGEYALMALRVLACRAPEVKFSAEVKAILYASAFGRETNFTRWGVISPSGFLPGVYGAELLSLGKAVGPYLQKYLGERRPAPIQGGKSLDRTHWLQQDRVCDYAWVLLSQIFDRPLAYTPDPESRDPQIRELDLWMDRRR